MIATTAPAKPANIMEALTREIGRVAVIRERYALLGGMPGADIPALPRTSRERFGSRTRP